MNFILIGHNFWHKKWAWHFIFGPLFAIDDQTCRILHANAAKLELFAFCCFLLTAAH